MRRKLTAAGVLLLLLFLLIQPREALSASRDGMKLWLNILIPTLLPFLILTGILLHTRGIEHFFSPLAPFWKKVFGLSSPGAYVLLLGKLCGCPMGAKLASDLYCAGKINRTEAHYLLTFCCNPSPAFLTGYLCETCLGGRTKSSLIFLLLLASDICCMLFFRFFIFRNRTVSPEQPTKKETSESTPPGTIVDVSIMNGFETITRLGGYILLFSILAAVIRHYWPFEAALRYLLLGITELTTGLSGLASSGLPYSTRFLCSMMMTSFGGLCILAQTRSVLKKDLSILPYFAAKCLNAALTGIFIRFLVLVQVV